MNYTSTASQFILQGIQHQDQTHATPDGVPTVIPIGTFNDRYVAENRIKRLSSVAAFAGYVLAENLLRVLSRPPTTLNTTNYDAQGQVVPARSTAKHEAANT